jgi:hypothetical protein
MTLLIILDIRYYVSKTDRKNDPYFYEDEEGKKKITLKDHLNCLDNVLNSEKSKEYYKLFFTSNKEWVSQIRRLVLNMNPEPFTQNKGGKKRIKNTKKRIIKKIQKVERIKKIEEENSKMKISCMIVHLFIRR